MIHVLINFYRLLMKCINHGLDDYDLDVRGVFLEILKAFDKAWHKDLIGKLR